MKLPSRKPETKAVRSLADLFIVVLVGLVLVTMLEMFRNIWINYGWSHPWLSTLIAAIIGVAVWWIFGALVSLSIRGSEPVASPSPTAFAPASVSQSATASGGSTINQAGRDIIININQGTSQEAIPGTNVTNAQLEEAFPLGYVVLAQKKGHWEYGPLPSEKMRYTMDWAQIQITPDFKNRTVHWAIPSLNSTNNPLFQVQGVSVTTDTDLDLNKITMVPVIAIRDQPVIFVGTLSDSQSSPVFVLGFRIFSKDEYDVRVLEAPWAR